MQMQGQIAAAIENTKYPASVYQALLSQATCIQIKRETHEWKRDKKKRIQG
jgi:hypothetical protein